MTRITRLCAAWRFTALLLFLPCTALRVSAQDGAVRLVALDEAQRAAVEKHLGELAIRETSRAAIAAFLRDSSQSAYIPPGMNYSGYYEAACAQVVSRLFWSFFGDEDDITEARGVSGDAWNMAANVTAFGGRSFPWRGQDMARCGDIIGLYYRVSAHNEDGRPYTHVALVLDNTPGRGVLIAHWWKALPALSASSLSAKNPPAGTWFLRVEYLDDLLRQYPGFFVPREIIRPKDVFTEEDSSYRAAFSGEWAEAERIAVELRPLLYAAYPGEAPGDFPDRELFCNVALAVVFPELSRYSYIRDVMETTSLEIAYVLNGMGDFSIGKMQMKPSFAESVEADADARSRKDYPALFVTGASAQNTRGLRILRLKDLACQSQYLAVFFKIMNARFPGLASSPETMVRIFAAAYNSGYKQSRAALEKCSEKYAFPYGAKSSKKQYCYSEIALDYYRSLVAAGQ